MKSSLPRLLRPGRPQAVAVLAALGFSFIIPLVAQAQLPPGEALAALRANDKIDVSLFASEPMITNPAAIDVDTHGRVWVAEIQFYRRQAKDPPADKIKVLEDTTGDGRADKVTVFADGVFCPMSICVAGDKVYVATSPDLWVYEDKNGDLVADGPPQKVLTGFGGVNHDHGAHSLVLGPDHKWWMAHGDGGFDVTGTDGSHIQYQWGAMLRGELDGSQLETVAVNFRNPYEICISSFGEPFCSDNDNDGLQSTRVCWIMEGGNYGWFGRPPARVATDVPLSEGWHFRAHIPGFVPGTLVTGFGSPCGICYYEADALPHFKNAPLHADAGPREVRMYRHQLHGAGMTAESEVFLTSEGDDYFRPDDICTAPDGTLYVADWYDGGVGGHAYNNPDQGRIYRLTPKNRTPRRVEKPGPYDTIDDALVGLKSANLATQYLARERLLADGEASIAPLAALARGHSSDTDPNHRARALWVLDRLGGSARDAVLQQLASPDSAFRALAVRILRRHGDTYAGEILARAGDESPEVRREVLLALPNIKGEEALSALVSLAEGYDGSDRYLLEALHIATADRKEQLYQRLAAEGYWSPECVGLMQVLAPAAAVEYVRQELHDPQVTPDARRTLLRALAVMPSPEAGRCILDLIAGQGADDSLRGPAIDILAANLRGPWRELRDLDALTDALRTAWHDPRWQLPVLALVAEHGLSQFGPAALALAADDDAPLEARVQAVATARQLRLADGVAVFESLLEHDEAALRDAALAGLIDLQHWPVLRRLLTSGADATTRERLADALVGTSAGALVLLRLLDEGSLAKELHERVIARAAEHPDANIRVLYERYLPADQRPQRLGEAIEASEILALPGNVQRGRQIFFQSSAAQCKNCHTIDGTGGSLGPDLSGIGRKYERAALLETILDPSRAMAPEYVPYLLETAAGQVFVGFVAERTDTHVTLKDAENRPLRFATEEVVALEPQSRSLMPELVLRDVTAQDAADLLAYLQSLTGSGGTPGASE